jgi:hypothetical protein
MTTNIALEQCRKFLTQAIMGSPYYCVDWEVGKAVKHLGIAEQERFREQGYPDDVRQYILTPGFKALERSYVMRLGVAMQRGNVHAVEELFLSAEYARDVSSDLDRPYMITEDEHGNRSRERIAVVYQGVLDKMYERIGLGGWSGLFRDINPCQGDHIIENLGLEVLV